MNATSFRLTILGTPVGKARPRFDTRTGRVYTPSRTVIAEDLIRAAWRDAGEPRLPNDAALMFRVEVELERPRSHLRRDGELSAAGLRSKWPTRRPDVDNCLKLALDALNGVAFRDDKQVCEVFARRLWGPIAQTLIEVTALP